MNKRYRTIAISLVTLIAALALAHCGKKEPLRVSAHPWIGYQSLYLGESLNWLSEDIEFIKVDGATDSISLLTQHKVDAAMLTLDEVLRVRDKGIDLVVVVVLDISKGGDKIIAKPPYRFPDSVAGKRIALERGGVGDMMLALLLKETGNSLAEVELIDMSRTVQQQAFESNEADIFILYSPYDQALQEADGEVFFSTAFEDDLVYDVLAVRRDAMDSKQKPLQKLIDNHFKFLSYIAQHRDDSLYRIAALSNTTPESVREQLKGVHMPSIYWNTQQLAAGSELQQSIENVAQLLHSVAMLSQREVPLIIDNYFVIEHEKNND